MCNFCNFGHLPSFMPKYGNLKMGPYLGNRCLQSKDNLNLTPPGLERECMCNFWNLGPWPSWFLSRASRPMGLLLIKYTQKMVPVLSSMVITASKNCFCEPNDVVFSCDFSKHSQNAGFRTIPIGFYITHSPRRAQLPVCKPPSTKLCQRLWNCGCQSFCHILRSFHHRSSHVLELPAERRVGCPPAHLLLHHGIIIKAIAGCLHVLKAEPALLSALLISQL